MEKLKITVLSHKDFDAYMQTNNIYESNVHKAIRKCFISIIGTKDCLDYYLNEPLTKHWFGMNTSNVMNLDFDDVDEDTEYEGKTFKSFSDIQAFETVIFIYDYIKRIKHLSKSKIVKEIVIHCRCGISRSRAIAEYICRYYSDDFDIEYDERERFYNHINHCVLRKLEMMHREYIFPLYEDDLKWQDYALMSQKICNYNTYYLTEITRANDLFIFEGIIEDYEEKANNKLKEKFGRYKISIYTQFTGQQIIKDFHDGTTHKYSVHFLPSVKDSLGNEIKNYLQLLMSKKHEWKEEFEYNR